jgi:hypothetical protein
MKVVISLLDTTTFKVIDCIDSMLFCADAGVQGHVEGHDCCGQDHGAAQLHDWQGEA